MIKKHTHIFPIYMRFSTVNFLRCFNKLYSFIKSKSTSAYKPYIDMMLLLLLLMIMLTMMIMMMIGGRRRKRMETRVMLIMIMEMMVLVLFFAWTDSI